MSDSWATPPEVFGPLHHEFKFELDVCAARDNAKLTAYFDEEQNGLAQHWARVNWCNPPYSNPKPWVEKAWDEKLLGNTTVLLLNADPSTRWWAVFWDHKNHCLRDPCDEVRYPPARIRFIHEDGNRRQGNNKPSAIIVLRGS